MSRLRGGVTTSYLGSERPSFSKHSSPWSARTLLLIPSRSLCPSLSCSDQEAEGHPQWTFPNRAARCRLKTVEGLGMPFPSGLASPGPEAAVALCADSAWTPSFPLCQLGSGPKN